MPAVVRVPTMVVISVIECACTALASVDYFYLQFIRLSNFARVAGGWSSSVMIPLLHSGGRVFKSPAAHFFKKKRGGAVITVLQLVWR
jgi:hypothetical protein